MYPYNNSWNREMLEEERKLMREINTGRMSWNKVGKIIRLNALLSERRQGWNNWYHN